MRKYVLLITTVIVAVILFFGIQLLSDSTPPILTVPESPLSIQCVSEEALLTGVKAYDGEIDVSESVIVENLRAITQKKTTHISYAVSDKHGNVAKATRRLDWDDTDIVITVTPQKSTEFKEDEFTRETFNIQSYFSVIDSCNNDITDDMFYKGDIAFDTAGTYNITLHLNNDEDFSDVRTITILSDASAENENNTPIPPENNEQQEEEDQRPVVSNPPVIVFRENPVTLPVESTFAFMSYIETIEDDIDDYSLLSRRIRISNLPNMFVEGEYTVTYLVTNTRGNTGVGELRVIVE